MRSRGEVKKAVEVLLYVTQRATDMYTVLKIIYFADKEHLSRHGRLMYGDTYVALQHGPVPSGAYGLVKAARGDGWSPPGIDIRDSLTLDGNAIVPLRQPEVQRLSASERECLDGAIDKYNGLPFGELKRLSHDTAYSSADQNDVISLEAIAKTLPNAELVLDYLRCGLD